MWRIVVIIGFLSVGSPALAQNKATLEKLNDAWTAAFSKGRRSSRRTGISSLNSSAVIKPRPKPNAILEGLLFNKAILPFLLFDGF